MNIKGQNLRVFVGNKAVAAATSCTLHISVQTEDSSTKDTTGDWGEVEAVGKSWDVSTESLVVISDASGLDAKDALDAIIAGNKVSITFDQTSGQMNREGQESTIKKSGEAYLTDLSISAANRQNATLSCQFTGSGPLT